MVEEEVHIDERKHTRVSNLSERTQHALLASIFDLILINIIAFWMMPGVGLGGFYLFFSSHPIMGGYGSLLHVLIVTLLILFGVFGWFQGRHFTDNLKDYIDWWKFW